MLIFLTNDELGGKMSQEEIRVAYELYLKGGCIDGKDCENWLEAERIVLTRRASQDIEEPEGEEPIIADEVLLEEVEGTAPVYAGWKPEEYATVVEEMEVQSPALGTKEDIAMKTEKIRPAKKTAAKKKKASPKKAVRKKLKDCIHGALHTNALFFIFFMISFIKAGRSEG
jgi:hypothetical protein